MIVKCKYCPRGVDCDGMTVCETCGHNPEEVERRRRRIRAQLAVGIARPHITVSKEPPTASYVIEDWTGYNDPV